MQLRAMATGLGVMAHFFFWAGMSFTYQFGANPPIDYPRILIADTVDVGHIFEDLEIAAFTLIASNVWQSGQFYTAPAGLATLPTPPTPYLRIAALMLDSLASNKARLAGAIKILDVSLDLGKASQALRDQAKAYRETDDDSGSFAIIEQVNNTFTFRDRWWAQLQRQVGAV